MRLVDQAGVTTLCHENGLDESLSVDRKFGEDCIPFLARQAVPVAETQFFQ